MTRFLEFIENKKKANKVPKPAASLEQWEFPTQEALDNYITVCLLFNLFCVLLKTLNIQFFGNCHTGVLNSIKTFIQSRRK